MTPILEVENISKRFFIQHRDPYLNLREQISHVLKAGGRSEEFWALEDVSFQVEAGESVGIIGRNGAGKSTLLKILSKITPPTSGRIVCNGRVASLLEVGTGFHPELTGRENIFLNGAILGMKRTEIKRQFDSIVDFAGTARFLDTALKHYSSGMQLRLAFAVAAFLEPEILLIDEVLAVGDAEFQRKCLGKMEEVSRSGRTILFVSHNMAAISSLCQKAILIDGGKIKSVGTTHDVIDQYLNLAGAHTAENGVHDFVRNGKRAFIERLEFLCDGRPSSLLYMGCSFRIRVHFKSEDELEYPVLGVIVYDDFNAPLLFFNNKNYGGNLVTSPVRSGVVELEFPSLPLTAGPYSMDIHFGNLFTDLDVKKSVFRFRVEPRHFLDKGEMLNDSLNRFFIKDLVWKVEAEK